MDIARLVDEWVPNTAVLYIGKTNSLRERLNTYRRHGAGASAGHWGGRFIWQCTDCAEFKVAWVTTVEDPSDVEFDLIEEFRVAHDNRLPFSNLMHGRRRVH